MKLRIGVLDDYKELCEMYKSLLQDIYPDFELGKDIFIYGAVQSWFKNGHDVVLSVADDGTTTGFSMAHIEDIGVIQPYYLGSLAYVKPKYRKGRSAYMLYNNVIEYATQQGLPVIAKAYVGNGNKDKVDKIQERWGKPIFTEYTSKGKKDG